MSDKQINEVQGVKQPNGSYVFSLPPGTWKLKDDDMSTAVRMGTLDEPMSVTGRVVAPLGEESFAHPFISAAYIANKPVLRQPADGRSLGQVAYDAYCAKTDGKSLVTGAPLPAFNGLNRPIQEAWQMAAEAVQLVV